VTPWSPSSPSKSCGCRPASSCSWPRSWPGLRS